MFKLTAAFFFILILEGVYLIGSLLSIYAVVANPALASSRISVGKSDVKLGYSIKPNSQATFKYPNDSIVAYIYTDEYSRRSSKEHQEYKYPRDYYFFGCSYTFGTLVDFDSTFSRLISEKHHANCFNYGFGGYGFAQMLVLLEQEQSNIDKNTTVFIQNSSWLAERAAKTTSLTVPFSMFVPYIGYSGKDSLALKPPLHSNEFIRVFQTNFFNTTTDKLTFIRLVISSIFQDQVFKMHAFFFDLFRKKPRPDEVESFFLNEVHRLLEEKECRVVIVGMGNTLEIMDERFILVDAERYLEDKLKGENYANEYQHMYDGELIDAHPNNLAHRRIFEAINEVVTFPNEYRQ